MTDDSLIASYRLERRNEALAGLLERHWAASVRLAQSVVRDPALAEDVAQEVFVKVAAGAHGYTVGSNFPAWLRKVTVRQALDVNRSKGRRAHRERVAFARAGSGTKRFELPDGVRERDLALDVARVLDSLPPELRLPLTLRYYAGMTHDEVAEALELRKGTASSRLRRGLEQLKERLIQAGLPASVLSLSRLEPVFEELGAAFVVGESLPGTVLGSSPASTPPAVQALRERAASAPPVARKELFGSPLFTGLAALVVVGAAAVMGSWVGGFDGGPASGVGKANGKGGRFVFRGKRRGKAMPPPYKSEGLRSYPGVASKGASGTPVRRAAPPAEPQLHPLELEYRRLLARAAELRASLRQRGMHIGEEIDAAKKDLSPFGLTEAQARIVLAFLGFNPETIELYAGGFGAVLAGYSETFDQVHLAWVQGERINLGDAAKNLLADEARLSRFREALAGFEHTPARLAHTIAGRLRDLCNDGEIALSALEGPNAQDVIAIYSARTEIVVPPGGDESDGAFVIHVRCPGSGQEVHLGMPTGGVPMAPSRASEAPVGAPPVASPTDMWRRDAQALGRAFRIAIVKRLVGHPVPEAPEAGAWLQAHWAEKVPPPEDVSDLHRLWVAALEDSAAALEEARHLNESSAITTLRTFVTVQALYRDTDKDGDGRPTYAASIEELVRTQLVARELLTRERLGYHFDLERSGDFGWWCRALPAEQGVTGDRCFYVDETGVIRFSRDTDIGPESSPMGS